MNAPPWLRLGWRNLGRNRRRTILTAGGLALGYFAVVVMTGLGRGMVAEMIGNGTGVLSGQLQIHADDYLPERSVYETIGGREGTDVAALVGAVRADPAVAAAAPRAYGGGLLSAGDQTLAAALIGIDPGLEPDVSMIMTTGTSGRLPRAGVNEIWIGEEMARQLGVTAGDELVVVAPAADGSLGNDLFVVSGLFRTGLSELDATVTFLPLAALQTLIALRPERVHEIAARLDDPWAAPSARSRLAASLPARFPNARPSDWTEFQPEMQQYAALFASVEWVLLVIVFVMAVFGVANTMLMAAFERRREFAVLRALGATPGVVLRAVLWESFVLGAASLAAGALITLPVLIWWHEAPPDVSWLYGDFTIAGGLVRPVLRVEYPPRMMALAAGALFVTALVAALLPALRAGRIRPADALQGR